LFLEEVKKISIIKSDPEFPIRGQERENDK